MQHAFELTRPACTKLLQTYRESQSLPQHICRLGRRLSLRQLMLLQLMRMILSCTKSLRTPCCLSLSALHSEELPTLPCPLSLRFATVLGCGRACGRERFRIERQMLGLGPAVGAYLRVQARQSACLFVPCKCDARAGMRCRA
eukprot:2040762-Pleurochrysis_carterae.AAC.1